MRKKRPDAPAPSVFKPSAGTAVSEKDLAGFKAEFRKGAADADRSATALVDANLKVIQAHVDAALADAKAAEKGGNLRLARGQEFALEIDAHLSVLQHARETKNIDEAVHAAMKAVEYWMMIRIDAAAASPINSAKISRGNLKQKEQMVSRQSAASAVVRFHGNKSAAARSVGLSRSRFYEILK